MPILNRSRLWTVLLVISLIAYCGFLMRNAWFAVSGSDSCGYLSLARLIVEGNVVRPEEELNRLDLSDDFTDVFVPLGFNRGPRPGTIAPMYPIGLPLHMVIGALIGGWEYGPYLVNPVIAAFSLILIYLTGMELGLSRRFSIAGAILLAAHPTFIYFMLQPMSDGTSAFWALVVIWASLRSRKRDLWGVLAGAAFGAALLVRPINFLLLIPVLFSLRLKPKVLLLFCLGGLPLAGIFFAYNLTAYGNPLKTGYIVTNHQSLLMLTNASARFKHYFYFLGALIGPLILLGWLGLAACRRIPWRDRALLLSWLGVFLVFYSFYDVYHEWWYTRFLLLGIPAMILGAMLTASELTELLKKRVGEPKRPPWPKLPGRIDLSWVVIIILMVISIGFSRYYIRRFEILEMGKRETIYPESSRWADNILPNRSLVFSMQMSSTLKFYTHRLIARYDQMSPDQWRILKSRLADKGYRCYALLWFWEVGKARESLPGKWERIGFYRDAISLWEIEPEP